MLSFKVYTMPPRLGGALVADWSLIHRDLAIETTPRGFGSCTATIPLPKDAARWHYASLDGGYVIISDSGLTVYEGRIEMTETTPEGLALTALGYSRAYSDLTVTELWSTMTTAEWQPITKAQVSNHQADRWAMDTNNRLYIAPNGGEAHDTDNAGALTFAKAAGANRQITSAVFDYSLTAPVGWGCGLYRFTTGYTFQTTVWSLTGNGATQTGSQTITMTGCDRLVFNLYRNQTATTLGTAISAVDTALNAPIAIGLQTITPLAMTNIVAGMALDVTDDVITTTIAAAVAVTGSQAVTPAAMTFIVVGTKLTIDERNSETVTVTAVTATTFTAVFAKTHLATSTVKRSAVVAEIVRVLAVTATTFTAEYAAAHAFGNAIRRAPLREVTPASMANIVVGGLVAIGGANPEQVEVLSITATTFTAEFGLVHTTADSVSPVWEGETGTVNLIITNLRVKTTTSATVTSDEIVRYLIAVVNAANPNWSNGLTHRAKSPGFDLKEYAYDGVVPTDVLDELAALGGDGSLWSWRVWEDQILIFDRIANGGQTFQIYGTPPISRDLGSLITRLVPRYTDANGVPQVAAVVINAVAERRYGLVRSAYFDAPTTSAADAGTLAQAALIDRSIVNAFGDLEITKLWQNGRRVPLTSLRSGDTVQCIEYPTTGNSETDKTRSFRVAITGYNHDARTLTISPEQRAPTIDSLLARREVQGKNR